MPETVISALVEGGKASAGPPLGPALGPTGINVGEVVKEINEKTKDFQGVQVPVKVFIDTASKSFRIEVGSPPVSALLKKELGVDNLTGVDIPIDYAIKVARLKKGSMLSRDYKKAVKEVLGTCLSMGVKINGKDPREIQKEVDEGKYDAKIEGKEELVFLPEEQLAKLREEKKKEKAAKEEKPEGKKNEGKE